VCPRPCIQHLQAKHGGRSARGGSSPWAEQRGRKSASRPRHTSFLRPAWREATQFRLPCSVLISPLWPRKRMGCARGHLGTVFVEKLHGGRGQGGLAA
jgi:hypothetical protein